MNQTKSNMHNLKQQVACVSLPERTWYNDLNELVTHRPQMVLWFGPAFITEPGYESLPFQRLTEAQLEDLKLEMIEAIRNFDVRELRLPEENI